MAKRLIYRCDDFGTASGANEAILRIAGLGFTVNVSVLACGPEAKRGLDELARLGPHVCLGVHAAINSEWTEVKWGPIGSAARETVLVDDQGYFQPFYPPVDEKTSELIVSEIEAQIQEALSWGAPFSYLDEHMGFGWIPGVADGLKKLASRYGLIYVRDVPGLPAISSPAPGLVEQMGKQLDAVKDGGPYLAIFHPALDDASTQKFYASSSAKGVVSGERFREFQTLTSNEFQHLLKRPDLQLITYRDL